MTDLLKKPLIGLKGGIPIPLSKSKVVQRFEAEKKRQRELEKKEREKSPFKGQLDLMRFIVIRRLDEFCYSNDTK